MKPDAPLRMCTLLEFMRRMERNMRRKMKHQIKNIIGVIVCVLIGCVSVPQFDGMFARIAQTKTLATATESERTSFPTPKEAIVQPKTTVTPTEKPSKKTKKVMVKEVTRKVTHINLRVGTKLHVKFQINPSNATNKTLRYVSRKKKYLTVSKKGVLTAKRAGVGKLVKVVAVSTVGSGKKCVITVRVLPKINPKKKMVALTFDDGPNTTSHHQIVSTLQKNNAAATFFVLGSLLGSEANKKEIARTYSMGNEIASHTQNHLQLTKLSSQKLQYEINKTDQMIQSIIGKKPALLREPYGAFNTNVLAVAKRPSIMWSIDTLDWKTRSANATYLSVMNRVSDGSIVLMHSIHQSTADAMDRVVPALKARGYQIVTVSEMYQYKGKKMSVRKANFGL